MRQSQSNYLQIEEAPWQPNIPLHMGQKDKMLLEGAGEDSPDTVKSRSVERYESLKFSVAICLIVVYTPVIIQEYPITKKGGGSREPLPFYP